jgi:predicted nucleic acid-binding protein
LRRLYLETNYVLELVLAQEQREVCETLLTAGEAGVIELAIPAYSLAEPLETLGRYHREREQLQEALQKTSGQLARSDEYRDAARDVEERTGALLARSTIEDRQRYETYVERIVRGATVIATDAEVLRRSLLVREEFDLDGKDAIVLASVSRHLDEAPTTAGFATRDADDFGVPEIRAHLAQRDCELLTDFVQAVDRLRQ